MYAIPREDILKGFDEKIVPSKCWENALKNQTNSYRVV